LERALDLLAERVVEQLRPTRRRVRLVPEPELLVELPQLVDVELEVDRHLVGDLHPVLGRRDHGVGALAGTHPDLLRDDVVHLVGGVEVERVEQAVEEQRRTGLDDLLEVDSFDRTTAVADADPIAWGLLQTAHDHRDEREAHDDCCHDDRAPHAEAGSAAPVASRAVGLLLLGLPPDREGLGRAERRRLLRLVGCPVLRCSGLVSHKKILSR